MNVSFHCEALQELQAAISYYEQCEPGLGEEFSEEVAAAVQRIADLPEVWPALHSEFRRCMTNRFPYGVVYSIEPEGVLIVAVMHLQRKAGYWRERR